MARGAVKDISRPNPAAFPTALQARAIATTRAVSRGSGGPSQWLGSATNASNEIRVPASGSTAIFVIQKDTAGVDVFSRDGFQRLPVDEAGFAVEEPPGLAEPGPVQSVADRPGVGEIRPH